MWQTINYFYELEYVVHRLRLSLIILLGTPFTPISSNWYQLNISHTYLTMYLTSITMPDIWYTFNHTGGISICREYPAYVTGNTLHTSQGIPCIRPAHALCESWFSVTRRTPSTRMSGNSLALVNPLPLWNIYYILSAIRLCNILVISPACRTRGLSQKQLGPRFRFPLSLRTVSGTVYKIGIGNRIVFFRKVSCRCSYAQELYTGSCAQDAACQKSHRYHTTYIQIL